MELAERQSRWKIKADKVEEEWKEAMEERRRMRKDMEDLVVKLATVNGKLGIQLARMKFQMHVESSGVARVPISESVARPADPAGEWLLLEAGEARASWFFTRDRLLQWPEPALSISLPKESPGTIRLESDVLVRDLVLDLARLDGGARVDRNLVSILPGEVLEIHYEGLGGLSAGDLHLPGVLHAASGIQPASP